MKTRLSKLIFLLALGVIGLAVASAAESKLPVLKKALMCEEVSELTPRNVAVVFSITIGTVTCYSAFDPVPEDTQIYHRWYHRDRLATQKRLSLKSPNWATLSSIQLRQADKGPWRVEITDPRGKTVRTLRFSITE